MDYENYNVVITDDDDSSFTVGYWNTSSPEEAEAQAEAQYPGYPCYRAFPKTN